MGNKRLARLLDLARASGLTPRQTEEYVWTVPLGDGRLVTLGDGVYDRVSARLDNGDGKPRDVTQKKVRELFKLEEEEMMTITHEQMQVLNEAAQAGVLRRQRTINDRRIRFSMTGKLSMKRSDIVTLIRAVEGVWDEVPGYGTDYLIVGDTSVHGLTAKMRTAQNLGVKIITEDDFVSMLMPS